MLRKWLNLFFNFSGYIFSLKRKVAMAENWVSALPYAILLISAELIFIIFSLPLYIAVPPKKLQENGFIFPAKEKDPKHIHIYAARRKISLAAIFGAGGIFLLKFIFIGLVSSYLFGTQALLAAAQDWNFSAASGYIYDDTKIEIIGETARLKDQGAESSCGGISAACDTFAALPVCAAQAGCLWNAGDNGTTANSDFALDSSGWTYSEWLQPAQTTVSGAYESSGGNPDGYISISLSTTKKNKTIAGLWMQAFTTAADSPSAATVNFDWKSLIYNSPGAPETYKLYAFIDADGENPVLGQEVWTSGEITGATDWASAGEINIVDKVLTAGAYYLKIAAYASTSNTGKEFNYISNFDNAIVNWSSAPACSGAPMDCGAFASDSACVAQSGCFWISTPVYPADSPAIYPNSSLAPAGAVSWNSFSEIADKNGGEINYQLSSDDGATWTYWDGAAWTAAADWENSNAASIINTNISAFSAAAGKIMWRAFLTSNGSQQIILDNISIGYTQNAAPVIQNINVSQDASSGYMHINYNLQDENSDPNDLVNYEYSLTGAFTGEQMIMTAVPLDPAHSGIAGLSSSPAGLDHAFVWDARADLGNVYSSVYIRLRANDGIASSDCAISSAANADFASPVISAIIAIQMPESSNIQISYDLFDNTTDNILVEFGVSSDSGASWVAAAPVAYTGEIGAEQTAGAKLFNWNAAADFPDQEMETMRIRMRAADNFGHQSAYQESADFSVDTASPVGLLSLNKFAGTNTSAAMVWSSGITDAHFNRYELWHGANQNDVINRADTALKWSVANDPKLDLLATTSTVITGIDLNDGYFIKIWAIDDYGNEFTIAELNVYSAPIPAPPPAAENVGGRFAPQPIADIIPPEKPVLSPLEKIKNNLPSAPIVLIPKSGDKITEDMPIEFSETPALPLAVAPIKAPAAAPAPKLVSAPLPAAQSVRDNIEAVAIASMPIPAITSVNAVVENNTFIFTGSALPNQDVIIYLHSDQALIYNVKTDNNGIWKINHSQNLFELTPGEHTIYAVAIDPSAKIKSEPSSVSTFTVSKNFWVSLFEKFNFQTTIITLVVMLLAMSWLYQIERQLISKK